MSAVKRIAALLTDAGFRELPTPLDVSGTEFEVDACFAGTGTSQDLILVGGAEVKAKTLVGVLAGLNRTLDRAESRRPVTLALLGARPDPFTLRGLEERARVLVLNDSEPSMEELKHALAILLPIGLPSSSALANNPIEQLRAKLGTGLTKFQDELVSAVANGQSGVEEALRQQLAQPFSTAKPQESDDA